MRGVAHSEVMRTVVIGGSRGLGLALARGFAIDGDSVTILSRTPPSGQCDEVVDWVECDISNIDALAQRLSSLPGDELDCLVFNAGIWEHRPFQELDIDEICEILAVDLQAAIVTIRLLIDRLAKSHGIVVLIGSTSALENEGSTAVVYTSAKFGLRGLGQTLREVCRELNVRVTTINIGSTATDVPFGHRLDALERHKGSRMPVDDIVDLVRSIRSLSSAACVKEIDMPAMQDRDA